MAMLSMKLRVKLRVLFWQQCRDQQFAGGCVLTCTNSWEVSKSCVGMRQQRNLTDCLDHMRIHTCMHKSQPQRCAVLTPHNCLHIEGSLTLPPMMLRPRTRWQARAKAGKPWLLGSCISCSVCACSTHHMPCGPVTPDEEPGTNYLQGQTTLPQIYNDSTATFPACTRPVGRHAIRRRVR